MQHKLLKNKLTHVVGLFDIHFPYEDRRTYNNVLKYIDDSQPDVIVLGGDVVDLDFISDKAKRRQVENKRFLADINYATKRLQELKRIAANAHIYFLQGNHDERIDRYIDNHPELEGIMELPELMKLEDNGIIWVPSWREGHILSIGKANFIHGQYLNKHHACSTVTDYGINMFYGHTHDVMCHSKVLHGSDSTLMAQSCGCLCRYDMPYLKGKPTKWQQAFLNMWIRPNGYFNHQIISIFKNQFIVNGVVYGN